MRNQKLLIGNDCQIMTQFHFLKQGIDSSNFFLISERDFEMWFSDVL